MRYLQEVTNSSPERILQLVQLLGPKGEEAYMTAAQILREEGRAEGRADVLIRQLQLKFGDLPSDIVTRVRTATTEELDRWIERVITATSLEDVWAA